MKMDHLAQRTTDNATPAVVRQLFGPRVWEGAILILAVLGAALRLRQYFFNRSFWLDEASLALSFVHRNLVELLLSPLLATQSAPPGFIGLVDGVARILGPSDWALRLVPLLSGIGVTIVASFLARREFKSPMAGIVFASLTAVSPVLVYYSSEFKQYSLDALVTVGLLTALSYRSSRHGTLVLSIVGFVSLLCSLPAIFVAASAGLLLICEAFQTHTWRRVAIVASSWATAVALHGTYFLLAGVNRADMIAFWSSQFAPFPPRTFSQLLWYPRALSGLVYLAFRQADAAQRDALPEWFDWQSWALGSLFVAAAVLAAVSKRPLALVSIGTFGFAGLAAVFFIYPFSSRLLIYLVPIVFFIFATALDRVVEVSRFAGVLLTAFLVVIPAQSAVTIALHPVATPDMREMLRQVQKGRRDGDAIAVSGWSDSMYTFYAPHFGLDKSRYFTTPIDNQPEGLIGPVKANQYGRVWFLLAFFTSDADDLINGVSRNVPVLVDWQASGARLVLFDFSNARHD